MFSRFGGSWHASSQIVGWPILCVQSPHPPSACCSGVSIRAASIVHPANTNNAHASFMPRIVTTHLKFVQVQRDAAFQSGLPTNRGVTMAG